MNTPSIQGEEKPERNQRLRGVLARPRMQGGLTLAILGFFVFTLGTDPGLYGLDRSPVVGFVQIAVLLVGLAMMCVGGTTVMNILWEGLEKTIAADIGYRLVSTGFVFAAASGMADVFGFGSQPFPAIPYFGPWQAVGVMAGEVIIILGFALMIPRPSRM
jgi:hypothetical protein